MYVGKEREGLCSWHTTMHGGGTSFENSLLGGETNRCGMRNLGGGTNRCDRGLNLSGTWQQGHSATYNTPSRI
ncbi:TPA_asm: hypothetical protein HUJ06_000021 [Nelumbo nucifera]|uniref:Uncharacterized protein n=1 Tax=Nelumbo nucifera TaxID=4432 RepID=A0A823A6M8_NELNU|nr:TPA_asm: hypothetical protein HUJ06_000021 [Nelumbo nucifera]